MAKKSTRKAPRASTRRAKPAARSARPARSAPFDAKAAMEHAITSLDFAREMTLKLLTDWPKNKLAHQFSPADNHPLWTLGHLGTSAEWFASVLDKKAGPSAKLNATFGGGSKPSTNPKDYPSLAKLIALYNAGHQRLVKALRNTKDPLAKPDAKMDWLRDGLHAAEMAIWHEGWHAGQLSTLRRQHGLPGVM